MFVEVLPIRMGLALSSLYDYFFGGQYKIVMVGLDNAGKTTILYRLCVQRLLSFDTVIPTAVCGRGSNLGDVISTNPTVGSNVEEVVHRQVRFQVWDLGGQEKLRKVWSTYYIGAHAVVLVIDSMDRERLPLVREELAAITSSDVSFVSWQHPCRCQPFLLAPAALAAEPFLLPRYHV